MTDPRDLAQRWLAGGLAVVFGTVFTSEEYRGFAVEIFDDPGLDFDQRDVWVPEHHKRTRVWLPITEED
jgi:hypothetical protein